MPRPPSLPSRAQLLEENAALRVRIAELETAAPARDITERQRAEGQVHESEARYRLLAENMADVIWVLNVPQGKFTYVSPSVERLRGYTAEEILAQPVSQALTPASNEQINRLLAERVPAYLAAPTEAHYYIDDVDQPCKDGRIVHTEVTTSYHRNAQGELEIIGVSRDITTRRQAELAWQSATRQLNTLLEHLPIGTLFEDHTRRVVLANTALCSLFGIPVPAQALTGADCRQSAQTTKLLMADPEAFVQRIETIVAERRAVAREELHLADGRVFERDYIPIAGDDERPGHLWQYREVTDRSRAEALLQASEERYRQLVENSPDIVYEYAPERGGVFYSARAALVLGHPLEKLYAQPRLWHDSIHPDDLPRVDASLGALTQGQPFEVEYRIRDAHGDWHWFLDRSLGTVSTDLGLVVRGLAIDITPRKRAEEALRESEIFARAILDAIDAHIAVLDETGVILTVNQAWRAFTADNPPSAANVAEGANYLEACGQAAGLGEVGRQAAAVAANIRTVLRGRPAPEAVEYPCHSPAEQRWFYARVTGFANAGRPRAVVVHENITERKRAEQQRQETVERFNTAFRSSPIGINIFRLTDERSLEANHAYLTTLGYTKEELLGQTAQALKLFVEPGARAGWVQALRAGRSVSGVEAAVRTKSGAIRHVLFSIEPFEMEGEALGMVLGVDITERKQAELRLQALLAEKDVLVKEIHHRVKNNLQVVVSLLGLQADRIQDPGALAVFKDSQERVRSIALVHEKLYQSSDLAHINFADYLQELTQNLRQIFPAGPGTLISVVADPVWLGVDVAIPAGLIVSELVTNALKYAFPQGRAGQVRVTFAAGGAPRRFQLTVSDDGVGLPSELDPAQTRSLGLKLVQILTRQLGGTLTLTRQNGVQFAIGFAERQERKLCPPQ